METLNRLCSCKFEPLTEVAIPDKAQLWTSSLYYDGSGWVGLPDRDKMMLKPTLFADDRLIFLDPVDTMPEVFSTVQSGKYDVKCWSKKNCHLGIEGDKNVFLSTPILNEVVVYTHPERLPTFPKSWKPLLFTVNKSMVLFRLTDTLCLLVLIDETRTMKIHCVDYNGGFAVSHPANDMALAYGSMAVKGCEGLKNCDIIPRISSSSGDWGFFVQMYKWGSFVIPKSIDLTRPTSVLGLGLGKKVDCLGILFHPPNMLLNVHLESPKVQRSIEYGKDYMLTAVKSSETDIDIYLNMDGHLVKYGYSFDIRINKEGKPKHTDNLGFKCSLELDDKKKCTRFNFQNTKNSSVLVSQGSPSGRADHLVSSQVIAVFDAEISMYLTHPPALKLCSAFNVVALPAE